MLGLCLAFLAAANTVPQLRSITIDLRQWGYRADPLIASYGEFYPPSHLLSIYENGKIAAGFIVPGNNLATRERPSLTLQVAAFDRQGKFLGQSGFPTTMWQDNGIWGVDSADLVIRTPETLSIWPQGEGTPAARIPLDPHTYVKASPSRHHLLLLSPGQDLQRIQLILSSQLRVIKGCSDHGGITSIVEDLALRFLRSTPPMEVQVEEICGPARFEYTWTGHDVRDAVLLDNTRFIVRSQRGIEVVNRDRRVWSDSFSRGEAVQEVEMDERGDTIAVPVARYAGSSQVLDINGHLKLMKIIVYRAADGKRIAELVVTHPPRLAFNFFALSPDGSVVAVLSGGFLQIAEVRP